MYYSFYFDMPFYYAKMLVIKPIEMTFLFLLLVLWTEEHILSHPYIVFHGECLWVFLKLL